MEFDVIISGGDVIDGTGKPIQTIDIGIKDGIITDSGDLRDRSYRDIIDAKGLYVAPGFIDMHTHSDFACIGDGLAESKVLQGVTSEIVGNCGSSAAPACGDVRSEIRHECSYWQITEQWETVGQYLEVAKASSAVNIGTLIGHGTVRAAVMGYADRRATPSEIDRMCALLRDGLSQGAFGLSTGLYYAPGCYSNDDEIVALLVEVARLNGVYATHLRSEAQFLQQSLTQALQTAKRSGIRLHISHLKAAGTDNHGKMPAIINLLEQSSTVTCDVYPYSAGHLTLGSLLPHAIQTGGKDEMVRKLASKQKYDSVCKQLSCKGDDWDNLGLATGWDNVIISRSSDPDIIGSSIADIASKNNKSAEQTVCDLIINGQSRAGVMLFMMADEDIDTAITWHRSAIASDATAITSKGPAASGKPHPRAYGTFPRIFEHYVQTNKLTITEAVRKMTSLPAAILGLTDRGTLETGKAADITIFSPDISSRATYDRPFVAPRGINWVLVAGIPVVAQGKLTGNLPGTSLRATREGTYE